MLIATGACYDHHHQISNPNEFLNISNHVAILNLPRRRSSDHIVHLNEPNSLLQKWFPRSLARCTNDVLFIYGILFAKIPS